MSSKLLQVIEHYGHELDSSNKMCCPFHNENTPSMVYYEDTDSHYCWGCGQSGNAINWICSEEGWDNHNGRDFIKAVEIYKDITGDEETYAPPEPPKTVEQIEKEREDMALPFNQEVLAELKLKCTFDSGGYRGIRSDVSKQFGVMFTKNSSGELKEVYYPTSKDSVGGKMNLTGFKVRQLPKTFNKHYGSTGNDVELFGAWKASYNDSDTIIICAGENDALAAQQMMNDNTAKYNSSKKTNFKAAPCVSGTVGENGLAKQLRANYDFLNTFKRIIYIPDQDSVGLATVEDVFESVPRGKLFIMELSEKDPHDMLVKGKQGEFISAYFKARPFMPDGVKSAMDCFDEIDDELNKERITLPPYMWRLQEMMNGGIIQGRICNLIAHTGTSKSTHVNRMVYHMIFNSPVTPTIVSLEATAGQYMLELLSIHLKQNLQWKYNDEELKDFIHSEEGKRLRHELSFREDGTPRFFLIDDRSGSIKDLEAQVERLYSKHNCRLLIIDVQSDLLRGSSADLAEDHMNWERNMVKNGMTIINVLHTRKPAVGQDGKEAKAKEFEALGTGSTVQSAAYNIIFNRDKVNDDPIERNMTEVTLAKCRGGRTGAAGYWFYDFPTVTCYDSEDEFVNQRKKEQVNNVADTF